MSPERPVLELAGVTAGYTGHPAVVEGIDLQVHSGSLVGIIGESGGGKSTLLNAMIGQRRGLEVRDGAIRYQGVDVSRLSPADWRRLRGPEIAMIFQRPSASFDPLIRVGRQFTESVRLHSPAASNRACRAHARTLLRRMRFDEPDAVLCAYPFELSGGMAQRAAIAMALLSEPRVLLADEPTSALDVRAQREVVELLRETAETFGTAVVYVSHQIALMRRLVTDVHILAHGHVVESGPVDTVMSDPRHPVTQSLIAAVPTLKGAVRAA